MQPNSHTYLPVHWMDGMKMNKNHFIAHDKALTAQVAQTCSGLLNRYNYGLLPNHKGNADYKLFVSTDNQQQVQVRLQSCRAITLGGHIVQINDDTPVAADSMGTGIPQLSLPFCELKGRSMEYLVILSVDPYSRIPYGDADPAEMPPRRPYTLPAYTLGLMPAGEAGAHMIGQFQLPVGKLTVMDQKVMLDDNYVPPCVSMSSHPDLIELHAEVEQFYGKMELHAVHIIQKVLQKKQ